MSPDRATLNFPPLAADLRAAQREMIETFVSFGKLLGQPRSVAEIYGLLFLSPAPLSMAQIIEELEVSKGSASQGLRVLKEIGAVRVAETEDKRREYFEAETALKPILRGLFNGRLLQELRGGEDRLGELEKSIGSNTNEHRFFRERLQRLVKWHRRARQILPLATRLLSE